MIRPVVTNEAFTLRSYGGIVNYFLHLLPELAASGAAPVIAAPLRRCSALDGSPFLLRPSLRVADDVRWMNRLANTAGLVAESIDSYRHRHDDVVLHSSYFYRDLRRRLPEVITIYDLIAELLPEVRDHSSRVIEGRARAVERADHIITISETTRQDVISYFGIEPERVTATPLASALPLVRPRKEPGRSSGNIVLFVGKRSGYKNFSVLLTALADPAVPRTLRLVACGGGSFTAAEAAETSALNLTDRVEHVAASLAALDDLYRRAMVYVCPSRYEGFGLPVLEAMERGCPVIVADAGALPEVAGGAALRFQPDDPAQLTELLVDLVERPSLARNLSLAGPGRSECFSWAKTAAGTMRAYHAALEAGS